MSLAPRGPGDERRALVVLLTVIFLNIAGFGLVIPLLPFFGQAFHAPAWQITLLFSAFSAGQFLGEPVWGRLSDRIGRRPVLIATISVAACLYVALAFAPNVWAAFAVRFASGFFSGNISTLQGSMADITSPERRAGRMGVMGSAFSLGFMTGPAIGGLLAQPNRGQPYHKCSPASARRPSKNPRAASDASSLENGIDSIASRAGQPPASPRKTTMARSSRTTSSALRG